MFWGEGSARLGALTLLAFAAQLCHAVAMENAKKLAEAEDRKLMASILKRREKPAAKEETARPEDVNQDAPMVKQAPKAS